MSRGRGQDGAEGSVTDLSQVYVVTHEEGAYSDYTMEVLGVTYSIEAAKTLAEGHRHAEWSAQQERARNGPRDTTGRMTPRCPNGMRIGLKVSS